jgi:cytochrome b561
MKLLPALVFILVFVGASNQAVAAKKKHHKRAPLTDDASQTQKAAAPEDNSGDDVPAADKPAAGKPAAGKPPLDFDFFGDKSAGSGSGKAGGENSDAEAAEREQAGQTRRWMLKTHQTLGIATWVLMAATVTVGQLNYNELYGGGGSNKWQGTHQILVLSTSVAFAAAAAFAIFAPTPYKKPLHFDSGLIHRIAVIGATLGMVTEGVLGWWTTHQANAGNPNNLRTMARTHQIVGYSTFGFLTIAGTVWLF